MQSSRHDCRRIDPKSTATATIISFLPAAKPADLCFVNVLVLGHLVSGGLAVVLASAVVFAVVKSVLLKNA